MQLSDNITDRVVYSVHVHVMLTMTKTVIVRTLLLLNNSFRLKTLTSILLQNNVIDFNKNIETLNILFNINFIDADKHYD